MKVLQEETFLRVRWETPTSANGEVAAFEATLCRSCRDDVWDQHPNVSGLRQFGYSCDLCEGRGAQRA